MSERPRPRPRPTAPPSPTRPTARARRSWSSAARPIARRTGSSWPRRSARPGFTGVTYDRRGRGESGDTTPYAVEREIEDLAAVIAAVAGRAAPPACTACRRAVRSPTARPRRHSRSAPCRRSRRRTGSTSSPQAAERLRRAPPGAVRRRPARRHVRLLHDRRDRAAAGGRRPDEAGTVLGLHGARSVAPSSTTACASAAATMPLPTELLGSITVPMVCFGSTGSPDWLRAPPRRLPQAAPDGDASSCSRASSTVRRPSVLAPVLVAHHGR